MSFKNVYSINSININIINDEKLSVFKHHGQQGKFPMTNKNTKNLFGIKVTILEIKQVMYRISNKNKRGKYYIIRLSQQTHLVLYYKTY